MYIHETAKTLIRDLEISSGNSLSKVLESTQRDTAQIDYLNLEKIDGKAMFTFLPVTRIGKSDLAGHSHYESPLRQSAKIGKVLRKLLPSTVSDNVIAGYVVTATSNLLDYNLDIKLISGPDIRKYYLETAYVDDPKGTLHKSCMRSSKCQDFFSIYEENPEQIQLCVGLTSAEKVAARAILWRGFIEKSDKPVSILDRVYHASELDKRCLVEWAKKNCDYYRLENGYFCTPTDPKGSVPKFVVPLPKWKWAKYPYIDTLFVIDKKLGRAQNFSVAKQYRNCRAQDGRFADSDGDYSGELPEGHVWLHGLNRSIPIADAVEIAGVWRRRSDCRDCELCHALAFQPSQIGTHYVCANHQAPYIFGDEVWVPCEACSAFSSNGSLCKPCEKLYIRCGCHSLIKKTNKSRMFTVDDEIMCIVCYDYRYNFCLRCANRCTKENLNAEQVCRECQ